MNRRVYNSHKLTSKSTNRTVKNLSPQHTCCILLYFRALQKSQHFETRPKAKVGTPRVHRGHLLKDLQSTLALTATFQGRDGGIEAFAQQASNTWIRWDINCYILLLTVVKCYELLLNVIDSYELWIIFLIVFYTHIAMKPNWLTVQVTLFFLISNHTLLKRKKV